MLDNSAIEDLLKVSLLLKSVENLERRLSEENLMDGEGGQTPEGEEGSPPSTFL